MLEISDLNIKFYEEVIFNNFSFSIKKGEKIALVGESGKGKSTLLNLFAGFIPIFTGKVIIDGIEMNSLTIKEIRKRITWLPQDTSLNSKTVKELIFTPFEFLFNKKNTPSENEVLELFSVFLLDKEIYQKKIKEISGGQKQRVILAGCILLKKPILLLDEPTSALDEAIKKKITDFVLSKKDLTVIASTHDEYWISSSDKVIEL